jgi:hypothetical protein
MQDRHLFELQEAPAAHALPVGQQTSPSSPHSTQELVESQTILVPEQTLPVQHGWPFAPQLLQLPLEQTKSADPQELLLQQG